MTSDRMSVSRSASGTDAPQRISLASRHRFRSDLVDQISLVSEAPYQRGGRLVFLVLFRQIADHALDETELFASRQCAHFPGQFVSSSTHQARLAQVAIDDEGHIAMRIHWVVIAATRPGASNIPLRPALSAWL